MLLYARVLPHIHQLSDWSLIQLPKPVPKVCYIESIQITTALAWVPKKAEPETKDYMQRIRVRDGKVKQARRET